MPRKANTWINKWILCLLKATAEVQGDSRILKAVIANILEGKNLFKRFPCLFRLFGLNSQRTSASITPDEVEMNQTCSGRGGRRSGAAVQWWDPWVTWQHYEVLGSWEKPAWKRMISVLCCRPARAHISVVTAALLPSWQLLYLLFRLKEFKPFRSLSTCEYASWSYLQMKIGLFLIKRSCFHRIVFLFAVKLLYFIFSSGHLSLS